MKTQDFDTTGYRRADGSFHAFTGIGCYPIFYMTKDGGVLCAECATEDGQTDDPSDPQWYLIAADVHWEGDPLSCDNCNCEIESAYGPVEDEPVAEPVDEKGDE